MSAAFQVVDALLKVALLPSHTEFPIDAAKEQLNDMLFKYNDEIMGVPMVYYDISFPPDKECGRILNELPWIHVDILAKMLVFQPRRGNSIVGQINKVCQSTPILFLDVICRYRIITYPCSCVACLMQVYLNLNYLQSIHITSPRILGITTTAFVIKNNNRHI
jgi:hypothetical protein